MHANEKQKGGIKIECGRENKSGPRPGNHPDIHANKKGKWKCGWGNTQKTTGALRAPDCQVPVRAPARKSSMHANDKTKRGNKNPNVDENRNHFYRPRKGGNLTIKFACPDCKFQFITNGNLPHMFIVSRQNPLFDFLTFVSEVSVSLMKPLLSIN